ncbi:MAG: S26 family signal peptidase [Phycisphaerales bacterium]
MDLSAVDFLPPRAADNSAVVRMQRRVDRWRGRLDRQVSATARALRAPSPDTGSWSAVAWSIVPGLGHLRAGDRRVGWPLLIAWLALLLLSLLNAGSGLGWLFLTGAVSVHSTAISLLFSTVLRQAWMPLRMFYGLGLYVVVGLVIYYPASMMIAQVVHLLPAVDLRRTMPPTGAAVRGQFQTATAASVLRDDGAIRDGDVLLYTGAWTRPAHFARGDIVVFRIDASALPGAGNVQLNAGLGVDRIVGLPGEVVAWKKDLLTVDGVEQPTSLWPIGGLKGIPEMEIRARDDQYVLLPTSVAANDIRAAYYASGLARSLGAMRNDQIVGKVFFRLRPWSRLGPVNAATPTRGEGP